MIKFLYELVFGFVALVFLIGCQQMFQPPPYVYEKWVKKNTPLEVIKEDIRKCGYPNFLGEGRDTQPNDVAKMHLCMKQKGYKYTGRFGTYCEQYPNLPACVEARAEKMQSKKR